MAADCLTLKVARIYRQLCGFTDTSIRICTTGTGTIKLCICGRSKRHPLCDNSHQEENWSCATPTIKPAKYGFASSPSLDNIALKLSAELQGQHIQQLKTVHSAIESLILLVDCTQVEFPVGVYERLNNNPDLKVKVFLIGSANRTLEKLFPTAQFYNINVETLADLSDIFVHIQALILNKTAHLNRPLPPTKSTLLSSFVSHAVKDEPLLIPVIQYIKTYYEVPLFSCHDSIRGGQSWHSEIIRGIEQSQQVVIIVSEAMKQSTFCAFEVGYALALKKPLVLISIDGHAPPAYVQHLHMQNLPRENRLKPWLNTRELLIEALLQIVT